MKGRWQLYAAQTPNLQNRESDVAAKSTYYGEVRQQVHRQKESPKLPNGSAESFVLMSWTGGRTV